MQDGRKAVWSIPSVSVEFFPSLKQNFIAHRSYKMSSCPDCIFEIHQLWQSGFSRVYSNSCCSCSFEAEIIKIGQSSHKMYSNNIVNFQKSTTILNTCTKKSGNLLKTPRRTTTVILQGWFWHWITHEGCCTIKQRNPLEDLPRAMNSRDEWWERQGNLYHEKNLMIYKNCEVALLYGQYNR